MSRRKPSSGFMLIELIVAASLSTIVLIGVFSLMSNMVQTEVDGMRNGTVTAWSLASINAMSADIAGASYLAAPAAGASGDTLIVCTNWSGAALGPAAPGLVNPAAPNSVYYYCYDTSDPVPYANAILRKVVNNAAPGACPSAVLSCTSGNYPGDIVATGVYRSDYLTTNSQPIFTADPSVQNAVRLRFIVGKPSAGVSAGNNGRTNSTVPQSIAFDTKVVLEAAQ